MRWLGRGLGLGLGLVKPNSNPNPNQVYEADGLRLRAATSGERGSGDGQLCDPGGLAVLGDELLVADVSNHRLACFGLGCSYRRAIGRRGTVPAAGWQKSSLLLPPIPWWCHGSAAPGPLGRAVPGSRTGGESPEPRASEMAVAQGSG